ncbi:hypothetical protein WMF18_39550 [Sorangium sp. So ce315]|uniref:hypothetical protein n=1 Tax=Sorangium sp. So ce315 TaxID=3133299 RepID=UPI003F6304AC
MDTTMVRLSPEPTRTRLLITQGPKDIGKVILPPAPGVHPRAAATLLEGLSLFVGERLCVVLCVDEESTSSCELGLLDGLGYGQRNVFYEIGVAARVSRAPRRAARGLRLPGDFRDLRQLSWEWSR